MTCSCGTELVESSRKIDVALEVNWADERGEWQGVKTFCSFSCLASWAFEKAVQHDQRAIISPPAGFEPAEPMIDTQTDTVIR